MQRNEVQDKLRDALDQALRAELRKINDPDAALQHIQLLRTDLARLLTSDLFEQFRYLDQLAFRAELAAAADTVLSRLEAELGRKSPCQDM